MPSESTDVPQQDDRKTAWVTGATSFLGRHVALTLSKRGFRVIGFSRHEMDFKDSHAWGYALVEGGTFDKHLLERAFDRATPPTAVFHTIGTGSVGQATADPDADADRTLRTSACLLEFLSEKAPDARLIYPSSAAVYGDISAGPISEDAPTEPVSIYGKNKLLAERIFRGALSAGRQSIIVRFFSVYGTPQRKLLFWDIGQRLLSGERTLTLGGTGEETRDLIHVKDAANVVAAVINADNPPALLNAASGRAVPIKTMVNSLANAMGIAARFRFDGHVRAGNPLHQEADIKLLNQLGVGTSVTLERGIAEYGAWLRANS